jgi:hypothetical protein
MREKKNKEEWKKRRKLIELSFVIRFDVQDAKIGWLKWNGLRIKKNIR